MKVLVTGSSGFIGSQICRALVERGDSVYAFHRSSSNLKALQNLPVEHITGDLTQPETLETAMQGMEAVFHTAALLRTPQETGRQYAVTVEGTRAVMQSASRAGVRRVVHTSSVAALGVPDYPVGKTAPAAVDENHTWNYRPDLWPYGYAKYLAELEVQRAVARGLDAVIVNPSLVFGPGDIYRSNNSLIVQVAHGRLPALVDSGVNVVHVDDVVAGHLAALERGKTGERYILGGENMTVSCMVRKIADVTGGPVPALVLPSGMVRDLAGLAALARSFVDLPVDPTILNLAGRFMYYDSHKAQSELGMGFPLPAEKAFADAWKWFQEAGV